MSQDARLENPKATRRDWIGLAVIALPCLLYSMDLTVLHLAVPQISASLRPGAAELLWIVDIYGFMVAGSLITMGTLGDRIGRRRLLLAGAAVFGLTSLLAAFAPTAELLIAARALQGISAATLAPSTLSLIRNMFHDADERAFAIGVWLASFSAGAALGPLIGGLVLTQFWWGAVFLINVPIMLLLLAVGPNQQPEFRDPNAGRIDVASAALSVAAVLPVIYGLKRTAEDGLAVQHFISIAAGLALAAAFFHRQRRLADPLIDIRLFRVPALSAALAINIAAIFIIFGVFLFIAQYLQLVLGMDPLKAGLWTAPSGIVFALGSMAASVLVRSFKPHTVIAAGFLIAAIGFAMLTQLASAQSPWLMFISMLIFCVGLAPIGAITTDLVMAAAPPERAGAASGISETSFEFGGALGIAVLGSVVTAVYRGVMTNEALAGIPPDAVQMARDTLGGAIAAAHELSDAAASQLLGSARQAFVYAFEVASAISAAGAVLSAVLATKILRGAAREP